MTGSSDLTCKQLVEVITDYVEGVMTPNERRRFDAHLAVCPGCQNYIEQMRGTIEAVGGLQEEMLPPETRERLLSTFRDWRRTT